MRENQHAEKAARHPERLIAASASGISVGSND
jgi:hypothetical protein